MANRFSSLIDGDEEKKVTTPISKNSSGSNRFGSLVDSPSASSITKTNVEPISFTPSSNYRMLDNEISANPIVGENLFLTNAFPIRKDDSIAKKGLKGAGNFVLSALSAPSEALRKLSLQGGSLLSGNGIKELPKNTSFTQDILPQGASNALNSFREKSPILGGITNMALETAVDPTIYIGGGTIKRLMAPKSEQGIALLKPPMNGPKSSVSSPDWKPPQRTRPFQRSSDLGPLQLNRTDFRARQAELNEVFKDFPVGSVDTPMVRKTLQEGIDSSLGIGRKTGAYEGLDAFGGPLKTFRKSTDAQDSVAEITKIMTKKANDVTKTLRQMDGETPITTIRSKIQKMGGIKPSRGDLFEEEQMIPSWIKDNNGRPLDEVADTLGMTSEELRATISSEAFKPKNYAEEAFKVLRNDPEYQALDSTLRTLKSGLPGKKTLKPRAIEDTQLPNEIPRYVQRIEEPNIGRATVDKPQGVYTSPSSVKSPHTELGGESFYWEVNPNAKVLQVKTSSFETNRGLVGESAGVRVARDFLGDQEVSRMMKTPKARLVEELGNDYPDVQWNKYYDQQEIVEGLAGSIARKNGYDAIWALDKKPEFNEFVALTNKAMKETSNIPTGNALAKSDIKLKPRELTIKPEPQQIQPQRMGLSGSLPADAPVRQLNPVPRQPLRSADGMFDEVVTPQIRTQAESPSIMASRIETTSPDTLRIEPLRVRNEIQPIRPQGSKIVGAEPEIPTGLKERGVSENIRTDANRPDVLRDSYSADPLVYKQVGNKETLSKAQTIFDQGLEPAITQLDDLLKNMKPEAAPLVKMIADKLSLEGNVVRARELMSNAALRATESGQFGQAFRILRDSDPETFLMTFDKQLKKLNKEGLAEYGKKWKDFDLTPDELSVIGRIERGNQASYDSVFEQIQARMANEMPATAFEKINAWRHISMLFNPKTQIRNVVGNGIMMGMRKSAQRVSGVLQKVLLPQSKRTQAVLVNKEYKDLASEYFEANKKDLLNGANKYQEGIKLNMRDKRVFRKSRIGEKLGMDIDVLEKTRKLNYELLQKGDTPFFRKAYTDRLASYAQAKGIKDFTKLDQEAFDIARLEAEQATYKDASVIANFINKVKNPERSATFGRKAGAVLTEAALPFTKTPINIIKRGVQYSPLGLLNGLAGINSAKGAAVAIDEMAKGLTGTGVLVLGYLLASKGILTGKAEKDVDLREYDKNTGHYPFSIMGKYSYDWAQPFSVPLSVGVEIYNAIKDSPEDTAKMDALVEKNDSSRFGEMALAAANGIMEGLNASGDTVFNMSIMKGVKLLLGSGYNGFMEGMAQLPQGYATQFIPTLSNQLAGTVDPITRQTYVKGDLPQSLKNSLVSRIPVASKTLKPKQTPFGEDVKKIENPIGRAASQFLSPGIVSKNQGVDPKIDSELRRLNDLGLTKQFPTMVPNYIEKTQTHPRITLTPEETTKYQRITGQLTLKSMQKVMNDSDYKFARKEKLKTADEVRAELLADAISESKATAKKEILKGRGLK